MFGGLTAGASLEVLDLTHRRAQESRRQPREELRIACRLEHPHRLASGMRGQQVTLGEHPEDVLAVSSALDTSVT